MKTVRIAMICLMLLSLITQVGAFAHSCPAHEKSVAHSTAEQVIAPSLTDDTSPGCHSSSGSENRQLTTAKADLDDNLCHCPQHGCSHAPSVVSGQWSPQFVNLAEKVERPKHFYSPLLVAALYRPPTPSF